jgi:putative transcriptional regulator
MRALLAFMLLCGMSFPTSADDAKPLTAVLLVARGQLIDASFKDSVVLVMNNLGTAPAGIIVNRPTRVEVSHLFPDMERLAHLHDKLYFGGPVELEVVWFLFRSDRPREHAVQAFDGVYVSADRDLLRELLARDKPMEGLRIFIGHSGWAPGQLEYEIARGDWTMKAAEAEAIFHGKSEHPWPERRPREPSNPS